MAAGIGGIDASIPLSGTVTPPDYYGGVEKGMSLAALAMKPQLIQQQINASRANELAVQAQTPGFQAESDNKTKDADFERWLTANAKNYTTPAEVDDTGKITKPPVTNYAAMYNAGIKNGFVTQVAKAQEGSAKAEAAAVKTQGDLVDYQRNRTGDAATALSHAVDLNATPDQMEQIAANFEKQQNAIAPGSGSISVQAFRNKDGSLNPVLIKAYDAARMSTYESGSLKNTQRAAGTTDEDADPKSAKSIAQATLLSNAGAPGIVPGKTSYTQMRNDPTTQRLINATVQSDADKKEFLVKSMNIGGIVSKYDNAIAAVQKLIDRGILPPGSPLSQAFDSAKARWGNDSDYLAAKAQLKDITDANPTVDVVTAPANALLAQISGLRGTAIAQKKQYDDAVNRYTYKGEGTGVATPAGGESAGRPNIDKPQEAQPAVGKTGALKPVPEGYIRMQKPDGTTGIVPIARKSYYENLQYKAVQ